MSYHQPCPVDKKHVGCDFKGAKIQNKIENIGFYFF